MNEFELILDETLRRGLSQIDSPASNIQVLLECLGYRCESSGLKAYDVLDQPFPFTLELYYSWPYPQMLTGEGYGILVVKNPATNIFSFYSVSEDHQTVTLLYESGEVVYPPTMVEIADFGKYVFLTNGDLMVFYDPEVKAWQRIGDSPTIPNMRTVCNFKGQAVGGNIISDWHDCDEKFYVWSKIGSMDFTPDKGNEAGYRRCPYGGDVKNVRILENLVAGYSSKGVTAIFPATVENVATFGFKRLSDIGIINQGAVAGDELRHIYVGTDFAIREITSEGMKFLDYKTYMKRLGGEDIIVNYDPGTGDFYIGNSEKTFLLSPYGMTEIQQHPSSVWRRNGATYLIPEAVDSSMPYLLTNIFDMGYRGQKTVFSVGSDLFLAEGPEAGVDYTLNMTTWGTGAYKVINHQGIATVVTAGNAFKFKLRATNLLNDATVSYLKVRYKTTDMRGIRGIYSQAPREKLDAD